MKFKELDIRNFVGLFVISILFGMGIIVIYKTIKYWKPLQIPEPEIQCIAVDPDTIICGPVIPKKLT